MQQQYDVVVVGAGFAGPVAAKKCAEAGLKTLMLERSENPGEKVISGLTIPVYGFLFGPSFIRDGNPPIERPVDGIRNYVIYDIKTSDIDIVELRIPRPLSPVMAFGYNAYCKPFIEWEVKKALESGAELRTSTTAVDVIRENGCIKGIVTDRGENIRAGIVINCEGSQGILAVKAGIREKYPPEAISLADTYDYECPKEVIDKVFGHTLRFCWGFDEQMIAPPLGHGNGLMSWPYRNSIHWMQDQCLALDRGQVPNLVRLFDEYHENITSQLPWWRDEIAPYAGMRARMWEGFEIFVGLDDRLRNLPNVADGMILVGDAAGLESTGLCDGVPAAWFSADIAADVAIEALKADDTSAAFLKKYAKRMKAHPIIQWTITCRGRWNLRKAQESHQRKDLKGGVNYQFGPGILTHVGTPLTRCILGAMRKDLLVMSKWVKMFIRYYYNWEHERFGGERLSERPGVKGTQGLALLLFNIVVIVLSPLSLVLAWLLAPLAWAVNPFNKLLQPLIELVLRGWIKMEPLFRSLTTLTINSVKQSNPSIFNISK
ncbi:MAG: NAD(P)/FAD-dependent oxidoreductase [Dehalococcoidia bacterium]|nr:NAD(P)/FAD-dependent oxidoreductase [Dehalococcoidia bacterium]MDD5494399.1 NAD(P)/FAD-dependent oxidoreductase [Dehalococcoidia bacterium]